MSARSINPQHKTEQVLRAARRLFVRHGYHNVSIPQIVAEAGVSIGAIYHHFGNKEGVAKAVHERTLVQFSEMLELRLEGRSNTRQQLRAFADLVFEVADSDSETMEYMLTLNHDEFLVDVPPICAAEPFSRVQRIISAGIAAGDLRQGETFIAAIAFTGVILRAVELRLAGVIDQPLIGLADALFDSAWAAIA